MILDPATGLVKNISFIASPNCADRPPNTVIDLIVVHGISLPPGQFGGKAIEALFTNQLDPNGDPYFQSIAELRVSAHFLIRRDGTLIQFVPVTKKAWHAGESFFAGRTHCNDFSIGIELEGTDTIPYEQIQYQQLASLIMGLQHHFPTITNDRIVGHSDIAPGRKTDPGPSFDWTYFRKLVTRG